MYPKDYADSNIAIRKLEKRKLRNIMRVLVLWSRNKKIEGTNVSFSYTKGLMNIA